MKKNYIAAVSLAVTTALVMTSCSANANSETESLPQGNIEFLIPYDTGGGADPIGREFSRLLGEELDRNVTVRNVPGGDELVGINQVTSADPDGLTLGMASQGGLIIQPLIRDDVDVDYTPLVVFTSQPHGIFTGANSEHDSIEALVAAAESNPGEVSFGMSNLYGSQGMDALSFQEQSDVEFNFVTFSGGAGDSALAAMGGQIDAFIAGAPGQAGLVESGELKGLGHTGGDEYGYLKDTPSLGSQGFNFAVAGGGTFFLIAPPELPSEIAEELEAAAIKVATSDEWQEIALGQGNEPRDVAGEDLEAFMDEQRTVYENSVSLVESYEID